MQSILANDDDYQQEWMNFANAYTGKTNDPLADKLIDVEKFLRTAYQARVKHTNNLDVNAPFIVNLSEGMDFTIQAADITLNLGRDNGALMIKKAVLEQLKTTIKGKKSDYINKQEFLSEGGKDKYPGIDIRCFEDIRDQVLSHRQTSKKPWEEQQKETIILKLRATKTEVLKVPLALSRVSFYLQGKKEIFSIDPEALLEIGEKLQEQKVQTPGYINLVRAQQAREDKKTLGSTMTSGDKLKTHNKNLSGNYYGIGRALSDLKLINSGGDVIKNSGNFFVQIIQDTAEALETLGVKNMQSKLGVVANNKEVTICVKDVTGGNTQDINIPITHIALNHNLAPEINIAELQRIAGLFGYKVREKQQAKSRTH